MADAHDRGRAWDRELARRLGGRSHPGSGNRSYTTFQLDASSGLIVASGKLTDADSIRLTTGMVDEVLSATLGPEGMSGGYDGFLALHMGGGDLRGPGLAVVDLDLYISQLKAPPQMVPATKAENLRATTRLPSYMRDK